MYFTCPFILLPSVVSISFVYIDIHIHIHSNMGFGFWISKLNELGDRE